MWGRLVIHIAGIYHEVTKSWGLTLGRFKPCSRLKFLPMLCHLRVTGHLDGYLSIYLDSEEDILAGLLWQETLCWRTLAPVLASSSRPLLLIQYIQGALFTDAEAFAAVMATRKKTKRARMGWPVWLKDLFTHTPVHTCTLHHTHIGTNTHMLMLARRSICRQTLPSTQMATWSHSLLLFGAHISKGLHCSQGIFASLPVRCLLQGGGISVRHQEKPLQTQIFWN